MDAKRTWSPLDRRVAMPLLAVLAAGALLAFAESPATAQSQGDAPSIVITDADLPPLVPEAPPAPPVPALMAPGEFEWAPGRAPAGSVLVVVSLPQQLVHVYRGGVRIGLSTVSTGKRGHDTPTGVFTVLQKKRMHRSNLYDDAPMPFMQRLTWDGVALHAGRLPGYPASHGCVRLPAAFAELLYTATDFDTVVVVADDASFGDEVVRPGARANASLLAILRDARLDEDAREGATGIAEAVAAAAP